MAGGLCLSLGEGKDNSITQTEGLHEQRHEADPLLNGISQPHGMCGRAYNICLYSCQYNIINQLPVL